MESEEKREVKEEINPDEETAKRDIHDRINCPHH
jgi:hypothetical protein